MIIHDLIKISSISGKEQKIQKYIFAYLSKMKLGPFSVGGNVVIKISGHDKNKALIYNCHVDTVPAGDIALWKRNPFEGKIVGGDIYGLGASDEKAAIATLLLLAKKMTKNQPSCDVWLTFVVNEEIDGSGTKSFVEWFAKSEQKKYKHIAAVLAEPTDLNKIKLAHKGNIFLKITTHGDGGHGSKPDKIKIHAVKKMYEVSEIVSKLAIKWAKEYKDELLGVPTVGLLTSISAGNISSPNKFPDSCVATFDIRTTPKLHDKVLKLITHALPGIDVKVAYQPAPFGYTDKKEAIVKIIQKISRAKLSISSGSNDLCFFTSAKIPGIVFGPGNENCIHQPNEYCLLENIDKCVKIYNKIIESF